MDSGKMQLYLVIGAILLLQSIYLGLKKRKDKNFYREPKAINLLSGVTGIVLLLYDLTGLWELTVYRDERIAVIMAGLMVLLLIFIVYRNFSTGEKYTVHNIDKAELEKILLGALDKYKLEYSKKEPKSKYSQESEVLLEQYNASARITTKGGSGKLFELVFNRFDQVYYFEDIVLDMKDSINKSTKAGRFRGIQEFAVAIGIVALAAWLYTRGIDL